MSIGNFEPNSTEYELFACSVGSVLSINSSSLISGNEFLDLISQLYKLSHTQKKERIEYWSKKIGIDHALDRLIKEYSKGYSLSRLRY